MRLHLTSTVAATPAYRAKGEVNRECVDCVVIGGEGEGRADCQDYYQGCDEEQVDEVLCDCGHKKDQGFPPMDQLRGE